MDKNFFNLITITFTSSFIYKITLLIHQIALYAAVSNLIYGQQSAIFAALYLLVNITNFGFDDTLLPFFSSYVQSQLHFQQLKKYLFIHYATVSCIAMTTIAISLYLNFFNSLSIAIIFALAYTLESFKKSAITIAHFSGFQRQLSYLQIYSLVCYLIMVWTALYKQSQSITIFFIPMVITSTIELFYVWHMINNFTCKLIPANTAPLVPFKLFLMQRSYNSINQIIKSAYSNNSMTLYFSLLMGYQQTATLKLLTNIVTLLYTCYAKSTTIITGTVLTKSSSSDQFYYFSQLSHLYIRLCGYTSIIFYIIYTTEKYHDPTTYTAIIHMIIFFIISFLEHISLPFEQFLINDKKSAWLTTAHCLSMLVLLAILYAYQYGYISQIHAIYIYIFIKSYFALTVYQKARSILL